MGAFRERIDRLISGRQSSDPLQVSNRSISQKVALAFLIALPCMLVIAVIVLVMPTKPPTVEHDQLTNAQIAARMLPGLEKTKVETNRDVEVVDAHVERKETVALAGSVRNNTDHSIVGAEVSLEVADADGSILGTVATRF